jgi:hypothetical protein
MKITKATYSHPDQDGDFSIEAEFIINNKHDFDCEFALISTVLLNENNVCVGGSREENDDCYIEAKNSGSLNTSFWGAKESLVGDIKKMKLKVSVTTYKLEYGKLGTVACPDVGKSDFIVKPVNLSGVAEVLGVSVDRAEDDEEGDAKIQARTAVRNIGDSHIQRVTIKSKILDKKDDEIFNEYDYDTLPSKSAYIYDRSLYGVKSGKAKGSTLSFSASVAVQLDSYTAEIVPTKESN